MLRPAGRSQIVLRHPFRFLWRVLSAFRANQGFLLAGAVAFNTLLSLVPMVAVILVALSQFVDQGALLKMTRSLMELFSPNEADALTQQIAVFLDKRNVIGAVGIVVLLTFSSFAFTALENAMSVIFFHRVAVHRRLFLVSAIIPYLYLLLLAAGLFVVSVVSSVLVALPDRPLDVFGIHWSLGGATTLFLYLIGVGGEVLLLTSLYLVMPVGRIALRHALIGGVTATVLWEITRHIMAWYFSTLSYVNVVYGSFTTVIVILLSLEAGAIILLLGAQVIAVYERIGTTYEDGGRTRLRTQ
ncbi:MAG TPA: YihY/virulence factor BrkB family protein [Gammaproteobacteria bacterium]|nr:YihY/virulence factor BrkB family protein [Gammaproteobacteria bacterium]